MAWIDTVAPADAQGPLRAIYDAATRRAGKVFKILELMSPQPRVLQASMGLYQATTTDPTSPLPRWFRELVAVTVSRRNQCHY